jgi:hypothetical protein
MGAGTSVQGTDQIRAENTLQGLSASPRVLPSRPPGRGRPAVEGDRRGSVRKKRTFWLNS